MRNVLCICLMATNVLCRTQATSIFSGAVIQNRDVLNHAGAPGSTKFLFPLHGNQERRGTAEYQTCINFSLILYRNVAILHHWMTELKGHYFHYRHFSLGKQQKKYISETQNTKNFHNTEFFPGTGKWLRIQ